MEIWSYVSMKVWDLPILLGDLENESLTREYAKDFREVYSFMGIMERKKNRNRMNYFMYQTVFTARTYLYNNFIILFSSFSKPLSGFFLLSFFHF